MPVKRAYNEIPVKLGQGGRLLPDLPVGAVGANNFQRKENFRATVGGGQRKIEGWDYPANTDTWTGDGLATFHSGQPAEAIGGIRRPNGTYAIVGCGAGFIKYFDYDTNTWVTVGSGYSTRFDAGFRRWKIVAVAGYAVFNNGRDLPCTWQVGDAAVTPLYELREAGYASVGDITQYPDGVLMCADLLEINDDAQAAVMNNPLPYKTIVDGITTTRISFNRAWSNIGNPRDFGVTVPGSITTGTKALTLAWPMASLQVGDTIIVTGAGAAGGNLQTTIEAISGVNVTLAVAAATTATDAEVARPTDLNSLAGYDQLEGDGSGIVRQIVHKTQLVTFKASGEIWQTYFTGDLDSPFSSSAVTKTQIAAPFPDAIVNVNDEYLLYPADKAFYKWTLGSQSAVEHPLFIGAQTELFFSRIAGAGPYDIWSAQNDCTGEILWAYRWSQYDAGYYGANRALAFCYEKERESLDDITDFAFTCAATVNKPIAGNRCDESEKWFLMGDGQGGITRYGRSNLAVLDYRRYGELFTAHLKGGLVGFGSSMNGKHVRRFGVELSRPEASGACTVWVYGSAATNEEPKVLVYGTLANPKFPGSIAVKRRKPYFGYELVSSADSELEISELTWDVALAETKDADRLQ